MSLAKLGKCAEKTIVLGSKFLSASSAFFMLVLAIITVVDVIMRFVYGQSIVGTIELTELLVLLIVALPLGMATLNDKNIKMDLIVERLPKKIGRVLDCITTSLSVSILLLICWQTFNEGASVRKLGSRTELLKIPEYPFYFILGASFVFLICAAAVVLVRTVKGKR